MKTLHDILSIPDENYLEFLNEQSQNDLIFMQVILKLKIDWIKKNDFTQTSQLPRLNKRLEPITEILLKLDRKEWSSLSDSHQQIILLDSQTSINEQFPEVIRVKFIEFKTRQLFFSGVMKQKEHFYERDDLSPLQKSLIAEQFKEARLNHNFYVYRIKVLELQLFQYLIEQLSDLPSDLHEEVLNLYQDLHTNLKNTTELQRLIRYYENLKSSFLNNSRPSSSAIHEPGFILKQIELCILCIQIELSHLSLFENMPLLRQQFASASLYPPHNRIQHDEDSKVTHSFSSRP